MECLITRTRGFLIVLKHQEGVQARLPDRAICPAQLLETGRSGSYGRLIAPHLLKVQVTLEIRKPGSYVPGWVGDKQWVALWLDL